MNKNENKVSLVLLASSLFLVSCGGSGSSVRGIQTLVEADFNNQTFIVKGTEQVADSFTFFNESKTGVELTGGFKNESFAKKTITWRIDNKKLHVTLDDGTGDYSFSREALNKNVFEGRIKGKSSFLHKALPIKLSDLDGKIFEFDLVLSSVSDPRGCIKRTLKVIKNKAFLKEVCTKESSKNITVEENVEEDSEYSNTLKFTYVNPVRKGDSIRIALASGDLNTVADVAFIYEYGKAENRKYNNVTFEKMTRVKNEAF